MEAANRGAREAGGKTIGLNIRLPFEQGANPYITKGLHFEFHYFFMRKFWFAYLAKALVIFPGGFGTLDEMFEILTLAQTEKLSKKIGVMLYGREYWERILKFEPMVEWGAIAPQRPRPVHVRRHAGGGVRLPAGAPGGELPDAVRRAEDTARRGSRRRGRRLGVGDRFDLIGDSGVSGMPFALAARKHQPQVNNSSNGYRQYTGTPPSPLELRRSPASQLRGDVARRDAGFDLRPQTRRSPRGCRSASCRARTRRAAGARRSAPGAASWNAPSSATPASTGRKRSRSVT